MTELMLNCEDIRVHLMSKVKGMTGREKVEYIKQFIILLLRRNQRFSESRTNIETIFKLKLPSHIQDILMSEKELYDSHKQYNSEAIQQLCSYHVNNSPICDDELLNTDKMSDSRDIILKELDSLLY